MASEELETLRKELPDGSFWPTGKWSKRLLTALIADRARLAEGSGSEVQTQDGRFFVIKPGSGGTGSNLVAFAISDASASGVKKIRVRYGTVQIAGEGTVTPTGMTSEDEFIFNVADNGIGVLILTVDGDGLFTSLTIGEEAALPLTDSTTLGYKMLGSWSTEGDVFTVTSSNIGNQEYLHCGGFHYWW